MNNAITTTTTNTTTPTLPTTTNKTKIISNLECNIYVDDTDKNDDDNCVFV